MSDPVTAPLSITELEFLKLTGNHAEFGKKLKSLCITATIVESQAGRVSSCWFDLGSIHLKEAQAALAARCGRTVYSRAYYAAYNASKATRYLVSGAVSLKGDDHGKASADLPADLPDVENWSKQITTLYEHRLRADYDNWVTTASENTLTPEQAVKIAEAFICKVRQYLDTKFGAAS